MHAPIPQNVMGGGEIGLFLSSLSYLTAPCIGLFFIVSGALLLPVCISTRAFLKKRFAKVLIPTIVWSLFYLCYNNLVLNDNAVWIRSILSLPFSAQGNPVLWYMYTLMGLYLIAPILSRWLSVASHKEISFYLSLWGISLCYPIISLFADVNISQTGVLYYFTGYVGYFVMGYYMKKYSKSISFKLILPATAIAIVAPVVCKLMHLHVDFYEMFWYLSIFVAIQCICWYRIIEKLCAKCCTHGHINNLITELSNLSFGIYLIHIFVMRYILWHCDFILSIRSYMLQTVITAILTFLISAIVCYIISFLPKSQYIIGYTQRKHNDILSAQH